MEFHKSNRSVNLQFAIRENSVDKGVNRATRFCYQRGAPLLGANLKSRILYPGKSCHKLTLCFPPNPNPNPPPTRHPRAGLANGIKEKCSRLTRALFVSRSIFVYLLQERERRKLVLEFNKSFLELNNITYMNPIAIVISCGKQK